MKLGSEVAKQAWADFEQYLKDVALVTEGQNLNLARMAFFHGFSSGELHKEDAAPAVSLDGKTIVKEIEKEMEKPKKQYKKGSFNRRSEKERQVHARLAASVLQSSGRAMQLGEITKLVNEAGANWYEKSASGFMLDAMERQPCIKKVGYGFYEYQQ